MNKIKMTKQQITISLIIEILKKTIFENFMNFNGRASRKEYWLFNLSSFIIVITLNFPFLAWCFYNNFTSEIPQMPAIFNLLYIFLIIYLLIIFVPSFAICVRRLHDIKKSGYLALLEFIPIVSEVILLYFLLQDSINEDNEYDNYSKFNDKKITGSKIEMTSNIVVVK